MARVGKAPKFRPINYVRARYGLASIIVFFGIQQGPNAATPDTCADRLQTSAPSALVPTGRTQIIETLVTRYPLLFGRDTVIEFESYFKKFHSGDSKTAEINFSFARSASAVLTLSAHQRDKIAEYIWSRIRERYGFNQPEEDAPHIQLAEQLGISASEAQVLWRRVNDFERAPEIRREIIGLITLHLPRFIERGALYVSTETRPVYYQIKTSDLGPIASTYKEARWRYAATLAAMGGVAWATHIFGVPWEPHWHGHTYWDLDSWENQRANIYWLQTAGAATIYLPFVSMGIWGNIRRTVRTIWHRRFVRGLEASSIAPRASLEIGAAIVTPTGTAVVDAPSIPSLRDLQRELTAIEVKSLDPDGPDYLASEFTRFAEVEFGERNLLASVILARLNLMLDQTDIPREWGHTIRDALARGEISASNQLEYSLRVNREFAQRKRALLTAREELTALDRALNDTEASVTRFLEFAQREHQRSRLTPKAARNLGTHIIALQGQVQMGALMRGTLHTLETRLHAQYEQLTRAISSLTLLNLGPAVTNDDLKSTWALIADKLGAP